MGRVVRNSKLALVGSIDQAPIEDAPIQNGRVVLFPCLATPIQQTAVFDAVEQLVHLKKSFEPSLPSIAAPELTADQPTIKPIAFEPSAPQARPKPPDKSKFKKHGIQALKLAIAVGVAVYLGYRPAQRLMYTRSAEAILNARVVTLRAPIEGTIGKWAADLKVGTRVVTGKPLFQIENRQADQSRVDDLQRMLELRDLERRTAIERLAMLTTLKIDLENQVREFRIGRINQLKAREAEYTADLAAAENREELADIALARTNELASKGVQTGAALQRSESEGRVAELASESLRKRLEGTRVELSAMQRGYFVGDSFNDVPASVQKSRDVELSIAELQSKVLELDAATHVTKTYLARESARYEKQATNTVEAPAEGRIWEMLISPGETVSRGQDMMRVLDCSSVVVTTGVDEAAYNSISLGQHATFRFRGDTMVHQARVVTLTGLGNVPSNFAILHNSPVNGANYHVTVELSDLVEGEQCRIGRTGTVLFDTVSSGLAP